MPKKPTLVANGGLTRKVVKEIFMNEILKMRQETRQEVLSFEDIREYKPLDYSCIRPLVMESDISKFDSLVASGKNGSVEIDLNQDEKAAIEFLRQWVLANGKNRESKPSHYRPLAVKFRDDFSPDGTHWVVDVNGMVQDGGHSGKAVLIAFYPPNAQYGLQGKEYKVASGKDENGKAVNSVVLGDSEEAKKLLSSNPDLYVDTDLTKDSQTYGKSIVFKTNLFQSNSAEFPLCGEFDDKNLYKEGSDNPTYRQKSRLVIQLRINANPAQCLKLADIRLEADYQDYLNMVGPIREYMKYRLPTVVSDIAGSLFKNYYLRINHSKDGDTFGIVSKGGRLNKAEVQNWFIAGICQLQESLKLLTTSNGDIMAFKHWTKGKSQKGGISLVNALTAMMIAPSSSERERIADWLTKDYSSPKDMPKAFREASEAVVLPSSSVSSPISNDGIIQLLVFVGNGKSDPLAALKADYKQKADVQGEKDTELAAWQVEANRFSGWDRSDTDTYEDESESFTGVCIAASESIAKILGNEGTSASAKLKATRKGTGPRGKNK